MNDNDSAPDPDTIGDVIGQGTPAELAAHLRRQAELVVAIAAQAPTPVKPPKHGFIRIVRSGIPGDDGVDTNLTSFLAEAKRRGQKVLDIGADEERNEHVIKVMRLRDAELEALEDLPPSVPSPPVEPRPLSDIERKREAKEAKRAVARGPAYRFMRIEAGEGGEERLHKAVADARRDGIKVVDWRHDEERGHYVIRALNQPPRRKARK